MEGGVSSVRYPADWRDLGQGGETAGLREAAAAEGSLKFCLGCGKSSDTKSDTTQQ